jgi:hypothetical protein
MNDKEKLILNKLVSLANKQQKLIHKLAQQVPPPGTPEVTVPNQAAPPGPAAAPPATALKPNATNKNEAGTIINSLPPAIKNHLVTLEVHDGQVKVKWKSPVSDAVFNVVTKTVQNLQNTNALPGKNYKVTEA